METETQQHRDCFENRCDYPEPHRHGFACGPKCPCGEGMQHA